MSREGFNSVSIFRCWHARLRFVGLVESRRCREYIGSYVRGYICEFRRGAVDGHYCAFGILCAAWRFFHGRR